MFVYDDEGALLVKADAAMPLYDVNSPRPPELADTVPESEVPLSEESLRLIPGATARLRGAWVGNASPEIASLLRDMQSQLRSPDKYEPLRTFATDVWRSVASGLHRNLIANVDDVFLYPSWAANPPTLRNAFKSAGGYNAEKHPGWLVARPSLASPPWPHRLDRSALSRLLRGNYESALDWFVALSEFLSAQPNPDAWETSQYILWSLDRTLDLNGEWFAARIYSKLPRTAKSELAAGRNVLLSSLSRPALEAIREFLARQNLGYGQGLELQPTIRFPDGVPTQGFIAPRGNDVPKYHLRYRRPDGSLVIREEFAGGFARDLKMWLRDKAPVLNTLEFMPTTARYSGLNLAMSENEEYSLVSVTQSFPSGRYFSWDTAPTEIKQPIIDLMTAIP